MSEVRPFFAAAIDESARPLGSTLRTISTPPATSPWSPKAALEAQPPIDTAAIEAEARARGLEQGLAETAVLRARLSAAIDAFTTARAALRAPAADAIAAAACAAIAGWTRAASAEELYGPLVRAWLDKQTGAAVAEVAPSEVDAVRALVGDAVTVTANASLARGDIRFTAATLELAFSWQRELPALSALFAEAKP